MYFFIFYFFFNSISFREYRFFTNGRKSHNDEVRRDVANNTYYNIISILYYVYCQSICRDYRGTRRKIILRRLLYRISETEFRHGGGRGLYDLFGCTCAVTFFFIFFFIRTAYMFRSVYITEIPRLRIFAYFTRLAL